MLFLDDDSLRRGRRFARLAADRAVLRFVNGLALVMDGSMTPMGDTPRDRILHQGKLEVFRYRAPEPEDVALGEGGMGRRFPVPLLLVPPLMVRPYVYDLRPEHSMVRHLLGAGFDVYLVDFGVPDEQDTQVRLDDYVLDYVPSAVEAVRRDTGRRDVTLAGYCMGGIFCLLHAAAHQDAGVRNIVTIGAPIDFHKMGLLSFVARVGHRQAAALVDRIGNIPGKVNSNALKMVAPMKSATRYADLFINLWNEEYVKGFEVMNRWANDFIPYPSAAFKQLLRDFVAENGLTRGLRIGDRTIDLTHLDSALLAIAGRDDQVATPAATRAILDVVKAREQEYVEVPGGHMGIIAGGRAPAEVWQRTVEWLRPRSL